MPTSVGHPPIHDSYSGERESPALLFAALGDDARLRLVSLLSDDGPMSISRLTDGSNITRQAITKHLHVLEQADLVHSTRQGREVLWQLNPDRLTDARRYLAEISQQWDDALLRLRAFVEDE